MFPLLHRLHKHNMDLTRILDAKPEPTIVDEDHFNVDPSYRASGDYKIPTPLSDFQKELIDQIVSLHYSDILKFFERVDDNKETELKDRTIIDSLDTLLLNTQLVCSHPYLLIKHYFPKTLTGRDLPKRLSDTSGKFSILSDIINRMDKLYNPRDKQDTERMNNPNINIGIVARSGKCHDLIDALCIGQKCNLKRYSGTKTRDNSGNLKKSIKPKVNVHLLPSDDNDLNEKMRTPPTDIKFKFLISFDITFDSDSLFWQNFKDQDTKIVRLVPINSIEHIALYYRDLVNTRNYNDYLKPVTAALVVMRDKVGQLPSELRPIYNKNLQFLDKWLSDQVGTNWPLPDLPSIPNFPSRDVEKSLLTEVRFNFDNDDFLKEEGTPASAQIPGLATAGVDEINLNFNFGGKTQMISHIIQPRFANKNHKKLDYYDSKRLNKMYLTNPLNKSYENLTGISREIQPNEILTHTLMYHFNLKMRELIKLSDEFKTYDEFNAIRINNYSTVLETYDKISSELRENEVKIEGLNNKVIKLNNELGDNKSKISGFKDEIDNYRNVNNETIMKDCEKNELLEEIENLAKKLESINNEETYMKTEIERAEKSIVDSETEIGKKNTEIERLQSIVENLKTESIENDNDKLQIEQINKFKNELNESKSKNLLLVEQMEATLKKLSSTTSGSSRSRYVNYSRNGLLSKQSKRK